MSKTAILLAAGSGNRMQGIVEDKVLAQLNGRAVFTYSIQAFLEAEIVDHFTIVYRDEPQRERLAAALKTLDLKNTSVSWALGGKERQDSVLNALKLQSPDCSHVFIHDCARPLVSRTALVDLNQAVVRDGAAVLAHPVVDTIKRTQSADVIDLVELEDLERARLWGMETPQAFTFESIHKAYQHVEEKGLTITDDTAAAATIGLKCTLVSNSDPNPKITTPKDLQYAEWLLQQRRE
ncbi:MAG: 2-C-methyl-D-erythritol 4-phosphate cytidylyltransferase [Opitutaceae bacterium]